MHKKFVYLLSGIWMLLLTTNVSGQQISGLHFTNFVPDFTKEQSNGIDTNNAYIFFQDELTVYKLPYTWHGDLGKGAVNELRYSYLVAHRDSTMGWYFPNSPVLEKGHASRMNKMEVINNASMLYKVFFDKKIDLMDLRLVNKTVSPGSSDMQLNYEARKKGVDTVFATATLHFSKELANVNYSMSHAADSIGHSISPDTKRGLKELIFDIKPWYAPEVNAQIDAIQLRYLVENYTNFSTQEIQYYIDRYRQLTK